MPRPVCLHLQNRRSCIRPPAPHSRICHISGLRPACLRHMPDPCRRTTRISHPCRYPFSRSGGIRRTNSRQREPDHATRVQDVKSGFKQRTVCQRHSSGFIGLAYQVIPDYHLVVVGDLFDDDVALFARLAEYACESGGRYSAKVVPVSTSNRSDNSDALHRQIRIR